MVLVESFLLWVLLVSLVVLVVSCRRFFWLILWIIGISRLFGVFMVKLMCMYFLWISVLLLGVSELLKFGSFLSRWV